MQSFVDFDFGRPSSAYVRRRLAEATLAQDDHDGSSWRQLDPGPPAVRSLSHRAESLHSVLMGNALEHVDEYMSKDTHTLAVGEALEAQLQADNYWSSAMPQAPPGHMGSPTPFQMSQCTTQQSPATGEERRGTAMTLPTRSTRMATIAYPEEGTIQNIRDVSLEEVEKRCPLLAIAFEDSRSGPHLYLETLSSRTAEPFVRFLNTGKYATPSPEWNSCGRYEDVPTSVLLHCEMFWLGDLYDLGEMKSQAYVNVLRQCEFGCSSPDKPIDLCASIRYFYKYLEKHVQLIDAIVNYCVACFLRHGLAEDAEFKQLAHDLRPFHQALCKNCIERDFENETAAAIIQMPFEPHRPETYASTEHRRFVDDVVYHFHHSDEMDSPKKRKRADIETKLPIRASRALAAMQKVQQEQNPKENSDLARSKRRPSVNGDSGSPFVKVEEGFEEIDLGPAAKEVDESDSDSFEWVDAMPTEPQFSSSANAAVLLLRADRQATNEKTEENESDSDWSLV